MKALALATMTFVLMFLTFFISVLSMIYGWGLEPKSWPVIVACYGGITVITVVMGIFQAVMSD